MSVTHVARRSLLTVLVGLFISAVLASASRAAEIAGLLDVTKQVAKVQSQVDALLAAGEATRLGSMSVTSVCGNPTPTRVFRAWGDSAYYVPVPSGSLETTAGWSWNDKSRIVLDNNSFGVGTKALLLADGGQAATPAMCVSTLHPTLRLFAKNTGSPLSTLGVSVIYEGVDGKVKELRIANLVGTGTWAPTISVPYYMNLIAAASPSGVTSVAFKFTASKVGARGGWTIDDLYVDPFKVV